MMRLQKYMALSGVASRRKSEELILSGVVKVNGIIIDTMGYSVDESSDRVEVNGQVIQIEENKVYILLNKPTGVVTTSNDQFGRQTVLDLLQNEITERVYPVGRLDYDTEGLIILTNDGELTNKILHPRKMIYKTYYAKVVGFVTDETLEQLKTGVDIGDYVTARSLVKLVDRNATYSKVELSIYEGKNRQVRRMFDAVAHPVRQLRRISIGDIFDNDLELGKWRYMTQEEIDIMKEW